MSHMTTKRMPNIIRLLGVPCLALLVALLILPTAGASDDDDRDVRFKARLFGGPFSGKSVYRERDRDQGVERRFKVEVEDGPAFATYDVRVNGALVGTVTTNTWGYGELKYRTAAFIDGDDDDWTPMPAGFPALRRSDIVTVGDSTGILFNRSEGTGSWRQKYRLEGEVELGNDDLEIEVKYRERMRWGDLRRRFEVEIEDGEAGMAFDVVVNGQFITTLVLQDDELEFELRTPEFIDDDDDGAPMPDDFPSLVAGDVVQIGSVSVVLEIDD